MLIKKLTLKLSTKIYNHLLFLLLIIAIFTCDKFLNWLVHIASNRINII